jgi:hypothetical protein
MDNQHPTLSCGRSELDRGLPIGATFFPAENDFFNYLRRRHHHFDDGLCPDKAIPVVPDQLEAFSFVGSSSQLIDNVHISSIGTLIRELRRYVLRRVKTAPLPVCPRRGLDSSIRTQLNYVAVDGDRWADSRV